MEQLKIVASARQIPDRQVTNQELSTMMETDDEWIYTRTGIHQRNVVTTENTSDLASEVAKKILAKSGVSPDSIDFIIVSTMSPDSYHQARQQLSRLTLVPLMHSHST